MKQHQYQITVREILEESSAVPKQLQFDISIHDDLFSILEFLKQRDNFTENEAAVFCVGLKLFGKILIEKRDSELFTELKPHFSSFMKKLKKDAPSIGNQGTNGR